MIDTNVLYSALRSKRGASYRLISQLPCKAFQVMLSVPLYVEYQEVLLRGKLLERYSKQEILGFLRYFC
ncbi:MAG: PIN domain-containing protein, partial [Planctomycetota bacterium]|nr:PIN domain-containing protein [Planctomycetota bacterium]